MQSWSYLPILKWKQGERMALQHLTPGQWDGLLPLIELPRADSSLPPLLSKWIQQINRTFPADGRLAIDIRYVNAAHPKPAKLLASICEKVTAASDLSVVPVISETMAAANPADLPLLASYKDVILRIQTPVISEAQISGLMACLKAAGIKRERTHLLVDQHAIVGEDPNVRAKLTAPYLDAALAQNGASVTLAGGAFPVNLVGYKQGITKIARVDLQVWQALIAMAKYKHVLYGDYAVTNPLPPPDMDPTEMNPSVAIRYAGKSTWHLFKAGGFKKGKPDQYRNLCAILIGDAVYSGAAFSDGDFRYNEAAAHKLGNGNPSSWRRDATSHHLVFTSGQV